MKFLSLKNLSDQFKHTFKRFPLALICSVIMACIACNWIYFQRNNTDDFYRNFLMTFYLGMISFISSTLFFNRYKIRHVTQWIVNFIIMGLMVFYYSLLPPEIVLLVVAKFLILVLCAHLSVAFSPFIVNTEINGFWQYNKTLFLRFFTSALYSAALFIGISLALLAIDNLFDVHINDKTYGYLLCIIGIVFNTWFFLSGIPDDIDNLNYVQDYPVGLRKFTQYVLLPLVTIYLLILYSYSVKILLTLHWPHGWVSYLVLGFSIAGILALLLVWPLRDDEGYKWICNYTKGFFIALFPLIVLLAFAIGRRVKEYGITENRFFVIALALWLFINAVYFLVSRKKNIKLIPMSLFIVAILTGFGPLSAFTISEASQLKRLDKLFLKNKMIVNGKALSSSKKISGEDNIEISSIVDYICDVHSYKDLQPYFKENLDSVINPGKNKYVFKPRKILDLIGLQYTTSGNFVSESSDGFISHSFSITEPSYTAVSGYDYDFKIHIYTYDDQRVADKVMLDSVPFNWKYEKNEWTILLGYEGAQSVVNLKPVFMTLISHYGQDTYNASPELMTVSGNNSSLSTRLIIHSISGKVSADSSVFKLNSLEGEMLYRK